MSLYVNTQAAQSNWNNAMRRDASAQAAWESLRRDLLMTAEARQRAVDALIESQWWDAATTLLSVYGDAPLRLDKSAKTKDPIGLCDALLQIAEAAPGTAALHQLKAAGRLDQLLRQLCIKSDPTKLMQPIQARLNTLGLSGQRIEGGLYWQGSDQDFAAMPQHLSDVATFYIGFFPVSQALYSQIASKNPSRYIGASRPVESITWLQALRFCNARLCR